MLTTVYAVLSRQSTSVAHRKPQVWALAKSGAEKKYQQDKSSGSAPNKKYGRLRPNRERVRSEIKPIIGSVTASQNLPSKMAAPASAEEMPTTSVR